MADFQWNECYIAQVYVRTARSKKNRDLAFFFFLLSSVNLARLLINSLHFLARSAVCLQMSCTSCLSNNDIQTPDQISVPCTTSYFHKDTLTPPSSSRSPPLEGSGPSTYAACDASLYNACPLLRDLHLAP